MEQQTDIPTVRVNFDRTALGRYGLQTGVAAEALETALVGREVAQILDGQIAVLQPKITVTANVAGRNLGSVVEDVQGAVAAGVKPPSGYRVQYSGQFGSQQAASLLLWLSLAVVVAMFFILAAAFGSSGLATLIMVNLPLALIGGIAGVFVAGGVLSVR